MSVFDFQCGHNIPESKGGKTDVNNLIPICSRCNQSMGSQYTIDEWTKRFSPPPSRWYKWLCPKFLCW
jgi:5-methylcytosine-specific restriction endonuclease McrA